VSGKFFISPWQEISLITFTKILHSELEMKQQQPFHMTTQTPIIVQCFEADDLDLLGTRHLGYVR